ncbi:hypothetical protein ES703_91375 [subsurface metagenome]
MDLLNNYYPSFTKELLTLPDIKKLPKIIDKLRKK